MIPNPATFGSTGRQIHRIGLGAMPLSIQGRPDEDSARRVIHEALDAGIELIDTANVYCLDDDDLGHNERLIGEVVRSRGSAQALVASKGGMRRPGGRWEVDGRPEFLRQSCERSLQALGLETIPLYYLHTVDPRVPLEESVGELVQLRAAGRIQHIGVSNVNRGQLDAARTLAPIAAVQNRCSPFEQQDLRNGLVDHCAASGIAYVPYSPVGGGRGKARLGHSDVLTEIAAEHGTTVYRVALAWLLEKGMHVFPIPGASRVESVRDSATAVKVELQPDEISRLDAL